MAAVPASVPRKTRRAVRRRASAGRVAGMSAVATRPGLVGGGGASAGSVLTGSGLESVARMYGGRHSDVPRMVSGVGCVLTLGRPTLSLFVHELPKGCRRVGRPGL